MLYVLKQQGDAILEKWEEKLSAKGNFAKTFWISINTWQIVKLLYKSSIK